MKRALYSQLEKDAVSVAERASKLLQKYQSKARIVVQKDIADFATDADIASEQLIRTFIRTKYPDHGILAEEGGWTGGKSEFLWVVDPLDGTKEYARGLKEYNCLIAIEHENELIIGVIKRVGIQELYTAIVGHGAKKDGSVIHVSNISSLSKSHIGYHLPVGLSFQHDRVARHFKLLERLTFACYRLRPGWDDAKALGYVASGITDATIIPAELPNGWHDLAAGILVVQEAGGTVTHLDGSPVKLHDMSKGFLASNGRIHDELLSLIRKELV